MELKRAYKNIYLFLWFAARSALTTRALSFVRGIGDTDACPICHTHAETVLRVLRDCI